MKKGRERGGRHFVRLLCIFLLASCSILAPIFFTIDPSSGFPSTLFFSGPKESTVNKTSLGCFHVPKKSICCDRSSFQSDVCVLRGDIRTSPSSSIFLYTGGGESNISVSGPPTAVRVEKIRPYPRKWEIKPMRTVDEIELVVLNNSGVGRHHCDVVHRVPAVVFSTGGYTGNVYQDFRDGIIPLYVTSYRFHRRVIFLVLNYRTWWRAMYWEVLSRLSAYPPIDFSGDSRTHCFPEITVGLRAQGDLAVEPSLTSPANLTLQDFRRLLDDAYRPRIRYLERKEKQSPGNLGGLAPPAAAKLLIISENGSTAVENEMELTVLCQEIGFQVQVLRPSLTTEMAQIYRTLNSTDTVLGVLGSALTHLFFMRPGAVFIQVLQPGKEEEAEAKSGGMAKEIGIEYIPYKIKPSERSISMEKEKDDPVLRDETKTVRLDLNRLFSHLTRAYQHIVARKMEDNSSLGETKTGLPVALPG